MEVRRCAYCGGCVNSCPVEALALNETALSVSEECIECGDCLSTCPVGALSLPGAEAARPLPRPRPRYDLVVVGAGPGGASAAQTAAQAGLSVLLLEKRQEIGSPVRCGETVLSLLNRFIESQPALERGAPVTLIAGNVPVAPNPTRLVKDGFMLVGDAARQVDPLTGGGILNAMEAGRLAALAAVEAVRQGDSSAGTLSRYEEQWHQASGRKNLRNDRLRRRFPPQERASENFVRAFALAAAG